MKFIGQFTLVLLMILPLSLFSSEVNDQDSTSLESVNLFSQFILSEILISGDSDDTLRPNVLFDSVQTALIINNYLRLFQDSGYFYCRLNSQNVRTIDSLVILELELVKGPLVYIENVSIKGLTRTDPSIVIEHLAIKGSELLTVKLVNEIELQARTINFLKFIPPVKLIPAENFDQVNLLLDFQERAPFRFDGGFGYLSGQNSEFIWTARIDFQNMFGRGKNISLYSTHPDKDRTTFELEYQQPVTSMGRGEFSFNLATRDYRDQFYEFESRVGYLGSLNRNYKYQLGLGWKRSEPAGDIEFSFDRYLFAGGVEIDYRDNQFDPSNGFWGNWNVEYRFRRKMTSAFDSLAGGRSFSDTRALFSTIWYQKVTGLLYTKIALYYESLFTTDSMIPQSEIIRVGGPPVLRGFRNEQFTVGSVVALSMQPYLRFSSSRLGLFVDAAYLKEIPSSGFAGLDNQFYRFGFGFDFNLFSSGRSLNFSLGWNKELPVDEPMLSVRFISSQ